MKAFKLKSPLDLIKFKCYEVNDNNPLIVPESANENKTNKQIKFFWKGYGSISLSKGKFEEIEIEEFNKDYTWDSLGEYVEKYGDFCAESQMGLYIMNKTHISLARLRNKIPAELKEWFNKTFNDDLLSYMGLFGSFNILMWERIIGSRYGYEPYGGTSIKQFMNEKFGTEVTERFEKEIVPLHF